eukprot:1451191-Rhodomonas_salina.1
MERRERREKDDGEREEQEGQRGRGGECGVWIDAMGLRIDAMGLWIDAGSGTDHWGVGVRLKAVLIKNKNAEHSTMLVLFAARISAGNLLGFQTVGCESFNRYAAR